VTLAPLAPLALADETAAPTAEPTAEEDFGGLPPGAGREAVYYSCTPCHSLMIVKQQGLNRHVWDETLVWMVEEQGMPPLEPPERALVLDYLEQHFGPDSRAQ
jgi:cytochrome c